jgi:hypothetical protein
MQRQATYKTTRISEHDEQANFFSMARALYGNRDDFFSKLLFSVPNGMWIGGKNPYALMGKFKAEGLQPGVSDVLYLQARGGYSCLAIEMKAQDKRNSKDAVSADQAEFLEAINASGGVGEVCYGCDEALAIFATYMSMEAQ